MAGVIGANEEAVQAALSSFAASRNGSFAKKKENTDKPNTLILLENKQRCSVLYPWEFFDWDEASQFISSDLRVPVFSLHIHDEDLWMFILFDKGEQVAQFNPLPEYWDDNISEEERVAWAGDPASVAARVPGISVASISPYFRHWEFGDDNPGKAFPDDQYQFHDCWQMCDFIRKIGLIYPLDDAGKGLGEAYEFVAPKKAD